jgi:hypothetical protein
MITSGSFHQEDTIITGYVFKCYQILGENNKLKRRMNKSGIIIGDF